MIRWLRYPLGGKSGLAPSLMSRRFELLIMQTLEMYVGIGTQVTAIENACRHPLVEPATKSLNFSWTEPILMSITRGLYPREVC